MDVLYQSTAVQSRTLMTENTAYNNSSNSSSNSNSISSSKVPSYLSELNFDVDKYPLPTHWNSKDKCSLIELSRHGLRAHYTGSGKTDGEAAAVRSNFAVPSQCGIYYFEVSIISKGRDGYIGIGLCSQTVSLIRLPGWEPNSYGYHGDDGNSFCCSGTGKQYGPTFSTGDIIGCCINFINGTCFYTKNGTHLGIAFSNLKGSLFPSIGLRTPGEVVEVNFGLRPFSFDIDHFVRSEKINLYSSINETKLLEKNGINSISNIIVSYLIHHGYAETAKAYANGSNSNSIEGSSKLSSYLEDLDLIKERQRVRNLVMDGEILEALELVQRLYPTVLEENFKLSFHLQCRYFVELVAQNSSKMHVTNMTSSSQSKDEDEDDDIFLGQILTLGKRLYENFGHQSEQDPEIGETLKNVFSLLAYSDPCKSPMAYLLEPQGRESIANMLNSAILVSQDRPAFTCLEQIYQQIITNLTELQSLGSGIPAFISLEREFLDSISSNTSSNNTTTKPPQ